MKWTPPDIIALILVITVLFSVIGGFTLQMFGPGLNVSEGLAMWMDFLKVIIGGLIGWMGRDRLDR